MDGASVVWVALMVFLYVEPSLGSRQLPKRATSPPSWLMQSTIVGKANRRSLCYFSGLLCYFFCQCTRKNLLFAPCCQNWHIYINTLYIRWRGGQTRLFNGISCCFDANFKIILLYIFFWNFLSLQFYTLFPTMQSTSPNRHLFCLQQVLNLTDAWIIMQTFVFSIGKHGGVQCAVGRRSHYYWASGSFYSCFWITKFFPQAQIGRVARF